MDLDKKREQLLLALSTVDMRIGQLQKDLTQHLQEYQQVLGALRLLDELIDEANSDGGKEGVE